MLRASRPLHSSPVASSGICIHRELGNEHVELPTCYLETSAAFTSQCMRYIILGRMIRG